MKIEDIDVNAAIDSVKQSLKNEKDLSPAFKSSLELLLVLVALLLNRITLNSKNSSKPPSADPNRKKSSKAGKGARKPGAQKGHKGRTLEPVENPDKIVPIDIDKRTIPTGKSYHAAGFEARQVIDL